MDLDAAPVGVNPLAIPEPQDLPRFGVSSFEAVFVDAYPRLVRSVTAACGDPELAADCVADAFERAYVRWWRIGRYDDPVGWVRRVALNRATDHHRRARRQRTAVQRLGSRLVDAPSADEQADLGADAELAAAVRALSPRQREVALAFYAEQRSVAEIATGLGLSDGAVKFHLHQARDRLRQVLEPRSTANEEERT